MFSEKSPFFALRRKDAKEVLRNAVALCDFAPLREKPPGYKLLLSEAA